MANETTTITVKGEKIKVYPHKEKSTMVNANDCTTEYVDKLGTGHYVKVKQTP